MRFYILKDDEFNGEIIKEDNNIYYRFVYGPNEWTKTNLFKNYLKESSKNYQKYEELNEKQVVYLLSQQIETYQRLWKLAFNLAVEKHGEAVDKGGQPYILHPKYVSDKFEVFDFKIVGILHDIVEDTDITLIDLEKMDFPKKIIKAIDAITRRKEEKYFEYIERVKKNGIARQVKIEDLKHNLLPERINKIENNESMKSRYLKALKILEE